MAIQFFALGTISFGSTSVTPGYPVGLTSGMGMVLFMVNKYPTNYPTTPAGWTLIDQRPGGHGADGVDTGNVGVSIYFKESDGTETGTLTVTVTSGNSTIARIIAFSKSDAATWTTPVTAYGANTVVDVAYQSVSTNTLSAMFADVLMTVTGINSDAFTLSAPALSIPGLTIANLTTRVNAITSQGQDCGCLMTTSNVVAGDTTRPVTFSFTSNAATADAPAGPTIIVRLREGGPNAVNPRPVRRSIIHNRLPRGAAPPKRKSADLEEIFGKRLLS